MSGTQWMIWVFIFICFMLGILKGLASSLSGKATRRRSKPDQDWICSNEKLLEHYKNKDWGLYRNERFDMAEQLMKEKRLRPALVTYLEVCYIDINGPNNCGGMDREQLKICRQFDREQGCLADGVVGRLAKIISDLGVTNEEVKIIFLEHNTRVKKSLRTPLPPDKCWVHLDAALNID